MTPMNPAFGANVHVRLHDVVAIFRQMKVNEFVYVSKHLAERMVERNIDPLDVARMSVPVIKLYRESTFNDHVSVVFWRHLKMVAAISLQPVTGQRRIVLKTIVDPDVKPHHFDVEFRL